MSAPDVTMTSEPDQSTLSTAMGPSSAPQMPVLNESGTPDGGAGASGEAPPTSAGGGSRLSVIMSAVANAFAGIPDKGRPSFITGLGQGARSTQGAQATEQQIKFANFDSQVRAAQLHNESLRTATAVQAGEDEHVAATDKIARDNMDYMKNNYGTTYTFVPDNDGGKEVQAHFGAQMAQNGAVSIPTGTIHTSQGFFVPNQGAAELAQAQTKDYNSRSQFWGMNPVRQGVVTGAAYDIFQHTLKGQSPDGTPMHADDLQNRVDSAKATLAEYQKNPNADAGVVSQTQKDIDNLQARQQTTDAREQQAILENANTKAATPQGKSEQAVQTSEVGKNKAETGKAVAETGKAVAETNLANSQANQAKQPDPFGVTSPLDPKQYNSRYNTFSKAYVQPLTKADQQLSQFANIQSDIDKTGNMTGAESVVGLFNAIGISASPLKGMGFRINSNTVEEHENARGLGQSLYQKFLSLKSGDVVTPQQLKDYASLATQARESQYNSAIDEARRQGLPVDFLPKGNGATVDRNTAAMYMRAAGNDPAKARAAAKAAGWAGMGQ